MSFRIPSPSQDPSFRCSVTSLLIHRHALAAKTLPPLLLDVMSGVIKLVNYIKRSSLNTRLFRELCKGLDASSETLLFHTEVCWLSKGNVVKRVFELEPKFKSLLFNRISKTWYCISTLTSRALNLPTLLTYFLDEYSKLIHARKRKHSTWLRGYGQCIYNETGAVEWSNQQRKIGPISYIEWTDFREEDSFRCGNERCNSGALESTTERIFVILSRFERQRLQNCHKSFQNCHQSFKNEF